jgi:hypothetical protein
MMYVEKLVLSSKEFQRLSRYYRRMFLKIIPQRLGLSLNTAGYLTSYNKDLGRVAQSVQRLTTGWTVLGSNPGGGEILRTSPDRPWGPPSLLYNGYRVFPGGRKRPGHDADLSPLLVPRSKNRVDLYLYSP